MFKKISFVCSYHRQIHCLHHEGIDIKQQFYGFYDCGDPPNTDGRFSFKVNYTIVGFFPVTKLYF